MIVGEFKIGNYYQDTTTGLIFLYRYLEINGNYVGRFVQCFTHGSDGGVIVSIYHPICKNMEHYASTFKEAFNKYWRENREKLILLNRLEMAEYDRKNNR